MRSPLVLSLLVTVLLVLTSVGTTMLPPDASEPGAEQLSSLRPSGGELAVWALGVVVLYALVLAGVVVLTRRRSGRIADE